MLSRQKTFILFLAFKIFTIQGGSSQEITGKSFISITPVIQRRFTN